MAKILKGVEINKKIKKPEKVAEAVRKEAKGFFKGKKC